MIKKISTFNTRKILRMGLCVSSQKNSRINQNWFQDTELINRTNFFQLQGEYQAKIVHVYDGDTLYAVINYKNFELQKWKIRLYGVDCPEMKPVRKGRTEESLSREKQAAKEIKNLVQDLVDKNEGLCTINVINADKYFGRYVAEIILADKTNLSEFVLNTGYAYRYEGKTKMEFDEWFNLY